MRLRFRRLSGLVLAAALFLVAAPAGAQPNPAPEKEPVQIPAGGTELFRGLLDRAGIKPVTERELMRMSRFDDVILISFGPTSRFNQGLSPQAYLSSVKDGGGAVLIANDTMQAPWVTGWQNTYITGERVQCPDATAIHTNQFGSHSTCPYVVPIATDDAAASGIFKGLKRVATNSPSFIKLSINPWENKGLHGVSQELHLRVG
jgi:hypothetical protein